MWKVIAPKPSSSYVWWLTTGALFYSMLPNAKECAMNSKGTYVVQKLIERALQSEVRVRRGGAERGASKALVH